MEKSKSSTKESEQQEKSCLKEKIALIMTVLPFSIPKSPILLNKVYTSSPRFYWSYFWKTIWEMKSGGETCINLLTRHSFLALNGGEVYASSVLRNRNKSAV